MSTADLSVVLPTYNHAHYLPRALQALLSQSVRPREVLVLDDASTDGTVPLVRAFADRCPGVRLIESERNLGCVAQVRRGVALCAGEYVYLTASDDFVLPGFVEKLVGELARHPRAGLAFAYHSTIEEPAGRIRLNPSGWCQRPTYFGPEEFARIVGPLYVPAYATVWRRRAFVEAGGYLPDLHWQSDWFAGLVVAFRHGVCHVPEPLALFTIRPDSYSESARRNGPRFRAALGGVLAHLRSPAYRDVVAAFAASGVMTSLGPELVRAAAARSDSWEPSLLSLIAGLPSEDYEAVLADGDAQARGLAAVLLGPRWLRARQARSHGRARLLGRIKGKALELLSRRLWAQWWRTRRAAHQAQGAAGTSSFTIRAFRAGEAA